MSYTALYRKFRPQEFEDVKGQDHIVTTLKNQIKADRIGHAYLFCGTRGTGKTTIAKIFAKAVSRIPVLQRLPVERGGRDSCGAGGLEAEECTRAGERAENSDGVLLLPGRTASAGIPESAGGRRRALRGGQSAMEPFDAGRH